MIPLEDKLHPKDFRFTEKLLYDQKTHEHAIKMLQAELDEILPAYSRSVVKMSHNKTVDRDSEPETFAIERTEGISVRAKYIIGRMEERRRHKEVITAFRQSLSDEENQFVWLFYDLNKSIRDCRRIMNYEKSKLYNMRQEVVYKAAQFLGLV